MMRIARPLSHTEKLGAGGMGVVYRATDTKLHRDVAIKVLPAFTETPERRSRFEREAQLLASLNHPNIASIYGLEESDGVHYLVLELVPGETLADRLKTGAIPVEEALNLAAQIADALDAAHETGVIHRDLKPANIMITPDGQVIVLDFGLAKAFIDEPSGENLSDSPTLSAAATREGVILGTAAYMSPEQARGRPVDKRTDVFAFGSVLYEMLTGHRAFLGEDVSDTLAAVIRAEPNWEQLPGDLDARIRGLLGECLQKGRKERRRDIGDVRNAIEELRAHPSDVGEAVSIQPIVPSVGKRGVLLALAASTAVGILAWFTAWSIKPGTPASVSRLEIVLPVEQPLGWNRRHEVILSPNGEHLVYASANQLYLRSLDQMEVAPIRGAEGDIENPFFSPDGEWVGFWDWGENKLKKVSIRGGAPVELCDAARVDGAHWTADDTIVFARGTEGIWRVSANGGTPELLIELNDIAPEGTL